MDNKYNVTYCSVVSADYVNIIMILNNPTYNTDILMKTFGNH